MNLLEMFVQERTVNKGKAIAKVPGITLLL